MSKAKFRYGSHNGPSVNIPQIVQLLDEKSVPTSATVSACYWSGYDILVIEAMFYSNVVASVVVPADYFAKTTSTARVLITDPVNSRRYDVYQGGENAVYLLGVQSPGAAYGVRIYGVKFGG